MKTRKPPEEPEWATVPLRTISSNPYFHPLEMSLVLYPRRDLRVDARAFHKPIIHRLVERGALVRSDLPRGQQFTEDLMVNYLRHAMMFVEDHSVRGAVRSYRHAAALKQATEAVGFALAFGTLNKAFLDLVSRYRPNLADACERQRDEMLIDPWNVFDRYIEPDRRVHSFA